jgi:hypothetical protein
MITAERLEELIKQGATIYYVSGEGMLKMINKAQLRSDHKYMFNDLSRLYETMEHYDWVRKMTAERTERFEPPMWEDIPNFYGFYRFVFSYNNQYTTFSVNKECNYIEIAINLICTYNEPATKENYIKACEIVRDLFNKGGAK